jgi:glycerophosphoryl diester phosphodiesterase
MFLVGHRACMDQYPENTLLAVREAAPHVDRVELDVRRCGSGELVLCRDRSLERVAGVEADVADLALAELRRTTVGGGQVLPTLAEALSALPADTGLHLELKSPGVVADAGRCIEGSDVVVISDDTDVLSAVTEDAPDIPTGYVSYGYGDGSDALATAERFGCASLEVHLSACIGTDLVGDAHDAGIEVVAGGGGLNPHACGIHDALLARRLSDLGVDGVMVDRWTPYAGGIGEHR